MGTVYHVTADWGNYAFVLRNRYTGAVYEVTVDADKIALFEDRAIFADIPDACPFLRFEQGGSLASCTIHRTRPDVCREVFCNRVLIFSPSGRRAGHFINDRTVDAGDPALSSLLEVWRRDLEGLDDARWMPEVIRRLEAAGYRVMGPGVHQPPQIRV
jgi:hypothetical protein